MNEVVQFLNTLSNPIMTGCMLFIAKQIQDLNTQIAVVISRIDAHEDRITRLEDKD
jgi:hypothetical protein